MRLLLVDGGSGSGKTTFAQRLARRWQELDGRPVQLVGMDEFYPGWHGLAAAQRMLERDVLHPVHPGYRRWDWEQARAGGWVRLDPSLPLLVEGCGTITPTTARAADLTIWLEMDEASRRARALGRDGAAFAPWWDTWAAQEREHWRRHDPRTLADLVAHPPAT